MNLDQPSPWTPHLCITVASGRNEGAIVFPHPSAYEQQELPAPLVGSGSAWRRMQHQIESWLMPSLHLIRTVSDGVYENEWDFQKKISIKEGSGWFENLPPAAYRTQLLTALNVAGIGVHAAGSWCRVVSDLIGSDEKAKYWDSNTLRALWKENMALNSTQTLEHSIGSGTSDEELTMRQKSDAWLNFTELLNGAIGHGVVVGLAKTPMGPMMMAHLTLSSGLSDSISGDPKLRRIMEVLAKNAPILTAEPMSFQVEYQRSQAPEGTELGKKIKKPNGSLLHEVRSASGHLSAISIEPRRLLASNAMGCPGVEFPSIFRLEHVEGASPQRQALCEHVMGVMEKKLLTHKLEKDAALSASEKSQSKGLEVKSRSRL